MDCWVTVEERALYTGWLSRAWWKRRAVAAALRGEVGVGGYHFNHRYIALTSRCQITWFSLERRKANNHAVQYVLFFFEYDGQEFFFFKSRTFDGMTYDFRHWSLVLCWNRNFCRAMGKNNSSSFGRMSHITAVTFMCCHVFLSFHCIRVDSQHVCSTDKSWFKFILF